MKCDSCGKNFEAGNRADGIPNGFGFVLENGKMVNVCADCIIEVGMMDSEQREEFFRGLQEEE